MRRHIQSRTAAHRRTSIAALLLAALWLVGCTAASDETTGVATSEATPSVGEPAPGGGDAERWAAEVCGAVSQWREGVRDLTRTVPRAITDAASVEEAEAAIGTTLESIAAASRAAAGDIADAELPDTENRGALENELDTIQQSIDDTGTAIDDALTEDQTMRQLASSVAGAVTTAEQSLTSVSDAWDRIGQLDAGAEVESALQDNADCQSLDREA
jgi:hypothetical protein